MRNLIFFLLLGASLMGLNGCVRARANYGINEETLDTKGEYWVIRRGNDIYVDKFDRTESKRMTYTPNISEGVAFIKEIKEENKKERYLFYSEILRGNKELYYSQKIYPAIEKRKTIKKDVFDQLVNERNK